MGFNTFSAEKTLTGKISDSMCGAEHKAMMSEHTKEGEVPANTNKSDQDKAHECTLACVKSGGKFVFVSGGKVYEIENQDYAGLQEHAGHAVKLTGEMSADGKTIKVTNVAMASKERKS
jgi:hypothetical protein